MKAADASVAVATFAPWHEHHRAARNALSDRPGIVAHAAFETYSVLTRLPEDVRAKPDVVWAFLEDWFGDRWIGLSAGAQRLALARLRDAGVSGGPTYDGLIAVTAAASEATLLTLDRRALATYRLLGADVELIA